MKILEKFSKTYQRSMLTEDATLKDILTALSKSGLLIICIVSCDGKLLGVVTDSDVRRALLSGGSLDDLAIQWMNNTPVTAQADLSAEELTNIARNVGKREIPLLNAEGELTDIFILGLSDIRLSQEIFNEKFTHSKKTQSIPNPIFILAGGLGTRLRSVVDDRPKSMALVGGIPLIEILVKQLSSQSFKNFFVSTNYLAEQVESHLKQDKFSELQINFLRENKRLGTAGAIGFIAKNIEHSILVCNADVLTNVNYNRIVEYHEIHNADITCVVRPFQFTVPYGVVNIDKNHVKSIEEKPKYDLLVNAGIYVLNQNVCKKIKENEYLDMPDLIKTCIHDKMNVIPFLLHEYWIDVGRPEDYLRANNEFHLYFGNEI